MTTRLRQFTAVLTALAIWVVSATCTSAGCLLPTASVTVATSSKAEKSCCAHHALPKPGHRHNGKPDHCPACDQLVSSIAPSLQKSTGISSPALSSSFIPLANFSVWAMTPLSTASVPCWGTSPPSGPPTLLNLHCALLT